MAESRQPDSPASPGENAPAPSFEAALAELETIVQSMEAGAAPLEEALSAYARGIALLRQCQDTLATAERRVRILEEGLLRDFDPGEETAGSE